MILDRMSDRKSAHLVHLPDHPVQLETAGERLGDWITPNEDFFVRNHLAQPTIDPGSWRLEFRGLLKKSATIALAELRRFENVTLPATLQCAGNGRAFFDPPIEGTPWRRGAIGNALWTGVRLRDMLNHLGIDGEAPHVRVRGYDVPTREGEHAWLRSIPLARALDPGTLIAFEMNGVPLPIEHGGPARLVVAGWSGNHWLKWLSEIELHQDEAEGHFQRSAYRIAEREGTVPVTDNPVKSIILRPLDGARLAPNINVISGIAFAGMAAVERVEISINRGSWQRAQLERQTGSGTWQRWSFEWDAREPGSHLIAARASDENGETQPERVKPNEGGYQWNGIDTVRCEIVP